MSNETPRRHWRDLSVRWKLIAPYAALTLVVGLPVAAVATQQLATAAALTLATLLLTLASGSIATRSIKRPLDALLLAMAAVAAGDLTYRARVESDDEIGRLTSSFNAMTAVLAERSALLERLSDDTLRTLAAAIDARDSYTHGHSMRVAAYSNALARAAGFDEVEIGALKRGCLVHDIGKIGITDGILRKPGPLDELERARMRKHPVIGHRMLRGLDWDPRVFDVVLHHHERWDGRGYPRGLRGERIPRIARVVAIADALDAMTSSRPYRPAYSFRRACAEISAQAGAQFDPELVAAFMAARDEIKRRADALAAGRRAARVEAQERLELSPVVALPAAS